MKRLLILSIILTYPLTIYSQTIFTFDSLETKTAKRIEKELKSKEFKVPYEVSISADYFPGASIYDLEQPLMYVRPENDFINDLEVEYFYTKSDEKVRLIVYNWDSKANSKKIKYDIDTKDLDKHRIEVYNKKYDQLFDYLTKTLGQPTEGTGELLMVKQKGYGESRQRKAKWDTEKCKVELNMVWTDQNLNSDQGYKLVPTFRIRAKIYWD
jgi:hypothetical protein